MGVAQSDSATSGYIFIYSPKIQAHIGRISNTLQLNEKDAVKLGTDKFVKVTVDPGKHVVQIKGKKQGGVILTVKSGETYFLKVDHNMTTDQN